MSDSSFNSGLAEKSMGRHKRKHKNIRSVCSWCVTGDVVDKYSLLNNSTVTQIFKWILYHFTIRMVAVVVYF